MGPLWVWATNTLLQDGKGLETVVSLGLSPDLRVTTQRRKGLRAAEGTKASRTQNGAVSRDGPSDQRGTRNPGSWWGFCRALPPGLYAQFCPAL